MTGSVFVPVVTARMGLNGLIGGRGAFESILPVAMLRPGVGCKERACGLPIDSAVIATADATAAVSLILVIVNVLPLYAVSYVDT
jgi:hypothetical protein